MRLGLAIPVLAIAAGALTMARVDREALSPRVDRVEPAAAAAGAVVTAYGANLGRTRVLELILTNEQQSALTQILEQSDERIRFRVPRSLSEGDYRIELVAATRWGTEVNEQSARFTVLPE
jgi:hypothetical protein